MKKINNKPTIALPKGRMLPEVLGKLGITLPSPSREYIITDLFEDCNIFLAKPKSIPHLIQSRMCEFGITGEDIMKDFPDRLDIIDLFDLGLNKASLVLAKSKDLGGSTRFPLVIVSEFENIASSYATENLGPHVIVKSYGSTEGYIKLGADYVIDIVETGQTLQENGLEIVKTLFTSSTHLYGHVDVCESEFPGILENLVR